ncbi:CD302 antigen [Hyperolius riggenbachi]|uniref:CD302 antigen n=1 Tax=Hyperolius riggenbachi TaxID=752182 RepID=UPI0035A399C0
MYITDCTGSRIQHKTREFKKTLLLLLCCVACGAADQSVTAGDGCPAPMWVQFNISCYTFIYSTQRNSLGIEIAREICKDIGADIISINTQEEHAFLLKTFKTKWKGPKEVLLGMFYDSDDDTLKWFDRTPVMFTNWREISDENLNTCVKMNTITGVWDSTDCDNFVESATLCKMGLYLPTENSKMDQRVVMIVLITVSGVVVPAVLLLLFILHKRKILWSGYQPRHLPRAAQALPYCDNDMLVDTMETEDCA